MKEWKNPELVTVEMKDTESLHYCGHLTHGFLGLHVDGVEGCRYHQSEVTLPGNESGENQLS